MKKKYTKAKAISFIFVLVLCALSAHATQLGMNYYHESMMRDSSHYLERSPAQVAQDMDDIKSLTNYVKIYGNPFYDENINWLDDVASIAKAKGMHVVVTMNTEDRTLDYGNWEEYRNRVLNACSRFNGKADEFLVGNEIALHTTFSKQEIFDRVAPLIDECKTRFNSEVSYEEFYWAREPWLNYHGKIYINMYEHYPLFENNIRDITSQVGNRLVIGEFGELTDGGEAWPVRGEEAQASDVGKRWELIKQNNVPVAYVFTYREPSETGFGIVKSDGSKKQVWHHLGGSSVDASQAPYMPEQYSAVQSLQVSGVSITSDNTYGDCRTLKYDDGEALICLKNGQYELSRQYGSATRICVGNGCLDEHTSWISFSQGAQSNTPTASSKVSHLSVTSSATIVSNSDDGSCREIVYEDNSRVKLCAKDPGYELYLLSGQATVCVGGNCVSPMTGFLSFT